MAAGIARELGTAGVAREGGTARGLVEATAEILRRAGCVAAEEEAEELVGASGTDPSRLAGLVERRCAGEPLAWLVGSVRFCGEQVLVHRGVYVPRWQSEPLAEEAVRRLPERGLAVDLCTGSGAVAVVMARRRPRAQVLATEIDPLAARNARANDVEVLVGDLTAPLAAALHGQVDVVTAVVPYVPSGELSRLPRDVLAHEPRRSLDGGADGTEVLVRAARQSAPFLRSGGSLLLELGGEEAELLAPALADNGYHDVEHVVDDEGDLRAVFCRRWSAG